VFSSSLAAFTIHHEHKKGSSGPDLLLSYHDNDHYNSVRLSNISRSKLPAVNGYSQSRVCNNTDISSTSSKSSTNASAHSRGTSNGAPQHHSSTVPSSLPLPSLIEATDSRDCNDSNHIIQQQQQHQQEKEEEMSATDTESSRLSGSTTVTSATDVTALTTATGYSTNTSTSTSCESQISHATVDTTNTCSGQESTEITLQSSRSNLSANKATLQKEKKRSISRINIIRGYRKVHSDDESVEEVVGKFGKQCSDNVNDDEDSKTVRTAESRKSIRSRRKGKDPEGKVSAKKGSIFRSKSMSAVDDGKKSDDDDDDLVAKGQFRVLKI
jgi:hypothetical protein